MLSYKYRINSHTLALFVTTITLLSVGCTRHHSVESSFEVASKGLHAAAISRDGSWSSVGSIYQGGSLWRNQDGERLFNWNHQAGENSTLTSIGFSPEGDWCLTADPHTLVLWTVKDGKAPRFWSAPGKINDLALSQEGNYALLGMADFSAVIFDVKRGGIKRTFNHQDQVRSVAMSDDGRLALTGGDDYLARLWDINSGKQILEMRHDEQVQLVALSPDGRLALSASQYDKAIIWETKTGKLLGEIPLGAENLRRGMRFTSAKFSADGSRLLTGRPDQIVQLWRTDTVSLIDSWELPKRNAWKPTSAAVLALSFTRNPNSFYVAASDGFIHRLLHKQ